MRGAATSCVLLLALPLAWAQSPSLQRGGTFTEPPAEVDPVYLPPARQASPYTPQAEAPPEVLTLLLGLDVPLRSGGVVGFGSQGAKAASPALLADLRWQPLEDRAWFVQGTFHRYLSSDREQPWSPHFSYSFGYDDGRPGTWSLVYSNYTGTRAHPDRALGQGHLNFSQGLWALSYRFALPDDVAPWFLVGNGDAALCTAGAQLTPRFADAASGTLRRHRGAFSFGCRYARPEGWFVEATAFAYPERDKQQPWDPDYTWAFGYNDWRPGTLSVQYSNYSGNRWPGRARGAGEGTPRSGSITFWWRMAW